jgi:hypothetical protein
MIFVKLVGARGLNLRPLGPEPIGPVTLSCLPSPGSGQGTRTEALLGSAAGPRLSIWTEGPSHTSQMSQQITIELLLDKEEKNTK